MRGQICILARYLGNLGSPVCVDKTMQFSRAKVKLRIGSFLNQ